MTDSKAATKKTYQVWTSENTKRVVNGVLSSMWESLPPKFRRQITEKRTEVLDSSDNDAVKSQKLWDLLDSLVIEAGEIAYDRMVSAKERWAGKRKVWDHKYQSKGQELAEKFDNLWALNAEGKVVIDRKDSTLRKVMQAHVLAMFAFTSDPEIWAPYGRCLNKACKGFDGQPKPILPDRNGKLHDCCSRECAAVVHPKAGTASDDLADDLAGLSPEDLVGLSISGVPASSLVANADEEGNGKSNRTGRSNRSGGKQGDGPKNGRQERGAGKGGRKGRNKDQDAADLADRASLSDE